MILFMVLHSFVLTKADHRDRTRKWPSTTFPWILSLRPRALCHQEVQQLLRNRLDNEFQKVLCPLFNQEINFHSKRWLQWFFFFFHIKIFSVTYLSYRDSALVPRTRALCSTRWAETLSPLHRRSVSLQNALQTRVRTLRWARVWQLPFFISIFCGTFCVLDVLFCVFLSACF